VGVTPIKAQHLTELRQAVNATRAIAGLSAATWTHSDLTNALIYAVDVQELRDNLGQALTALSVPATSYDDPQLTVGTTLVKKVHIDQLRQSATRGSSTSSGPSDSGTDSATTRLDPMNRTGGGGRGSSFPQLQLESAAGRFVGTRGSGPRVGARLQLFGHLDQERFLHFIR